MFRLRYITTAVKNTRVRSFHSSHHLKAIQPYLLADIGEGIKECEVIQWFVEPGAKIEEFDLICEVQSDKASVEITSRYNGVIKKLHYDPGQMALVGHPLVDIDIPDNELPKARNEESRNNNESQAAEETSTSPMPEPVTKPKNPKTEHIPTLATPAVRRICREKNIEISQVTGSGKDGRVMKEDVLNFESSPATTTSAAASSQQPAAEGSSHSTTTQLSPIQRQMFKTMTNSLSIPHFLYTDEVPMDKLAQLRKSMNQELVNTDTGKISYMPFFIKALSLSLNKYPLLNSAVTFENDKPALINRPYHNIGVAMDTPQGLIVPNIKSCESKSLLEISKELQRLQNLGKDGKLTAADLKNGTITISNIGTVGGTYLQPVIVDSEVAIVGLGRSRVLPRFDDKMNVVPETIINTSWSGDHRVIDGMTMARMVDQWKQFIQQPEKMLMYMK